MRCGLALSRSRNGQEDAEALVGHGLFSSVPALAAKPDETRKHHTAGTNHLPIRSPHPGAVVLKRACPPCYVCLCQKQQKPSDRFCMLSTTSTRYKSRGHWMYLKKE